MSCWAVMKFGRRSFFMIIIALSQVCECIDLMKRLKKLKNVIKGKKPTKWQQGWNAQRKEYPGVNKDLKKNILDQWEAYYKCLEEEYEKLGDTNLTNVKAHIIEEGKAISLECEICLSPAASYMESVTWRKLKDIDSAENSPPLGNDMYDEKYITDPDDGDLAIVDLQAGSDGDAGLYACFHGGSIRAMHFLHVAGDDEPVIQVKPLTAPKGPHPQTIKEENGLTVYTDWQSWSPCSAPINKKPGKCYKAGKRARFGACKVALASLNTEELQEHAMNDSSSNITLNSTVNNKKTKSNITSDHIIEILRLFGKTGLPCRSPLLSTLNWSISKVRPSEIMTAYCKLSCPKDMNDELKERVLFDSLESIPPLPPPVKRMVIFQDDGSEVILKCPSVSIDEPSTLWKIGNFTVRAVEIKSKSKGRLFIDVRDHFHIKSLKLRDANIYSCWHDDHLIATMKVHVSKRVRFTFNHHLALIIMASIFGVIAYIFMKVMMNSLAHKDQKTNAVK
ncbi:uncharacterized protein LOC124157789 [Ischnura elegans]|uniref:uncharacterized protein LOC124157789 n=1 Tax=Ischnura elegans TaxID=197161 RepID=UPI001ED88931|nr:uncharacterized protein LOC124157789 [Ischnura elegans]